MSSIGVAIPCYKHHIPFLKRCLDSIEAQTVKPQKVVVSCSSSVNTDIINYKYSFPLKILTSQERKNAAENRNYASSFLNTDIVTFFDCDDEMHPQRLEYIVDSFEKHSCDIVLHSYLQNEETAQPFQLYDRPDQRVNVLRRAPSGCAVVESDYASRIHHSQVSVKKSILESYRFKEDVSHERREDSVFCGDVLATPGIQSVYLKNPLSKYYMAGMWV
jgi:glycosyltransferase involved in cell wall biosynthesis